ncbi:MAG: hypothetical protein CMJ89_15670 [Planctomycetes bacterium]|nr:hypothetical protein [Planctomycetota bacterium]
MHAEEFDFSEDDSEDDVEEERFSFAGELSQPPTPPEPVDHVELPEPPIPAGPLPAIPLHEDVELTEAIHSHTEEPEELELSQPQLELSQPQEELSQPQEEGAGVGEMYVSDTSEQFDVGNPTLPHVDQPPQSHFPGPDLSIAGDQTEYPPVGNRPATGARQVSAGEILSGDFHGTVNAGDFLGLDTEFTDPLGSVSESAGHQYRYSPPCDDDLGDVDGPVFGDPSDSQNEGFVPPADPYESEEAFEGEFEEDAELEYEESGGGPLRLVIVTVICAVLGAGGVFYAPKFISGDSNIPGSEWVRQPPQPIEGTQVATAPATPARTPENHIGDGAPRPRSVTSTPLVDPPTVVQGPPNRVTLDPLAQTTDNFDATAADPEPLVAENTSGAEPAETQETIPPDVFRPPVVEVPVVSGGDPIVEPPTGSVVNLLEKFLGQAEPDQARLQTGFPSLDALNFEWISDDRLDMIWRGQELPPGAVEGPVKTLMPHVGMVRVTMRSEQIFEGRLYSAGQNGVWIEYSGGRIRLEGAQIADIERLAMDPSLAGPSQNTAATGKRVKVKAPGGLIFGRVQKQHGGLVTIRTDKGARVVVESHLVEALGSRRAVLVHR